MDDGWEDLGAVAALVVKGVALAAREDTASAALAGTGEARRAHHDARGGTGVVIWVNFGTGAAARGPYMPPRQCFRDRTPDERVGPSRITPATGGLGNRILRKL